MMTAISDAHIVSLVANVEAKMTATYGAMSTGQLHMVRQTLQRFFLGGWSRGEGRVAFGVWGGMWGGHSDHRAAEHGVPDAAIMQGGRLLTEKNECDGGVCVCRCMG